MAAPTNLTVYYGTSSSVVIAIPTVSGTPQEVTQVLRNAALAGFFSFYDSNNLFTAIPWNAVTKVTAA
jgi:hypothetical protein